MPDGQTSYKADDAYNAYFTDSFRQGDGPVSGGNRYGSSLRKRIDRFFERDPTGQEMMDPKEQFKRDVGFWYGAIQYPGAAETGDTIKRLFGALYYGGLMVRKNDGGRRHWVNWNSLEIPIAASLSHTARVLIQLPRKSEVHSGTAWDADWNTFWNPIYSAMKPRMAATHSIILRDRAETVTYPTPYIFKYVAEAKGRDEATSHYHINVALGGVGRRNPFSGKTITNVDGRHGHLYFGHRRATDEAHGGLLVATEQSAPCDVAPSKGVSSTLGNFFVHHGIPDQYGGVHGLGGHNKYSATCGDDWGKGRLGIHKVEYYDGLFLDVSQPWQVKHIVQNWNKFTAGDLNRYGLDPVDPRTVPGFKNYGDTSLVDKYMDKFYRPQGK